MGLGLPSNLWAAGGKAAGDMPMRLGAKPSIGLRAGERLFEEDEEELARMAEGLPEQSKGALYTIGRGADYFGRGTRSMLMGHGWDPNGEGDVSGWDILNAMGAGKKQKKYGEYSGQYEGFINPDPLWGGGWNPLNWDYMDLAAFGIEVLTDPLTYALGGFGHAAKAPRAAKNIARIEAKALQRAQYGATLKSLARGELDRIGTQRAEGLAARIGAAQGGKFGQAGIDLAERMPKHIQDFIKKKKLSFAKLGGSGGHVVSDLNQLSNFLTREAAHSLLHARKVREKLYRSGHKHLFKAQAPNLKKALKGEYLGSFDDSFLKTMVEDVLSGKKGFDDLTSMSETMERLGRTSWVERLYQAQREGAKTGTGRIRGMLDEIGGAVSRQSQRDWHSLKGVASGELSRGNTMLSLGIPEIGGPILHGVGRTAARIARILTYPTARMFGGKGMSKFAPKVGGRQLSELKKLDGAVEASIAATIDDALEGYVTGRFPGKGSWFGTSINLLNKEFIPEVNLIKKMLGDGIGGQHIGSIIEHIMLRVLRAPIAVAKEAFATTQIPKVWRRYFKTGAKESKHLEGLREAAEYAITKGAIDVSDLGDALQMQVAKLGQEPVIMDMLKGSLKKESAEQLTAYLTGQSTEIGPDAGAALQDIFHHFDSRQDMSKLIEAEAGHRIREGSKLANVMEDEYFDDEIAKMLWEGTHGVDDAFPSGTVLDDITLDPTDELGVKALGDRSEYGKPVAILLDENDKPAGVVWGFAKDAENKLRGKVEELLNEVMDTLHAGHTKFKEAFGDSPNWKALKESYDRSSTMERLEYLNTPNASLGDNPVLSIDQDLLDRARKLGAGRGVGKDIIFKKGETVSVAAARVTEHITKNTPGWQKPDAGIIGLRGSKGKRTGLFDKTEEGWEVSGGQRQVDSPKNKKQKARFAKNRKKDPEWTPTERHKIKVVDENGNEWTLELDYYGHSGEFGGKAYNKGDLKAIRTEAGSQAIPWGYLKGRNPTPDEVLTAIGDLKKKPLKKGDAELKFGEDPEELRQYYPPEVKVGTEVYMEQPYKFQGSSYDTRKVDIYVTDKEVEGLAKVGSENLPFVKRRVIKSKHPWGESPEAVAKSRELFQKLHSVAKQIGALEETTGLPGVHKFDTFVEKIAEPITRDFARLSQRAGWKELMRRRPEMAQRVRQLFFEPMFWNPQSRYYAKSVRMVLNEMAQSQAVHGLKRFFDPAHLEAIGTGDAFRMLPEHHPLRKLNIRKVTPEPGETAVYNKYVYDLIDENGKVLRDKDGMPRHGEVPRPHLGESGEYLNEQDLFEWMKRYDLVDDNFFPVDDFVDAVGMYYPRVLSEDVRAFMSRHPQLFDDLQGFIKSSFNDSTINERFLNSRRINEFLTSEIDMVDVLKDFNAATYEFFRKVADEGGQYGRAGTYNGVPLPKSLWDETRGGWTGKMFENDPVKAVALRALAQRTAQATGVFIQSSILMFAKPKGKAFRGPALDILQAAAKTGARVNYLDASGRASKGMSLANNRTFLERILKGDEDLMSAGLRESEILSDSEIPLDYSLLDPDAIYNLKGFEKGGQALDSARVKTSDSGNIYNNLSEVQLSDLSQGATNDAIRPLRPTEPTVQSQEFANDAFTESRLRADPWYKLVQASKPSVSGKEMPRPKMFVGHDVTTINPDKTRTRASR